MRLRLSATRVIHSNVLLPTKFFMLCDDMTLSNARGVEEAKEEEGWTLPYASLSNEIVQYMMFGEVLFLGDFNARTWSIYCGIA